MNEKIIQHNRLWKTLKQLGGNKNNNICLNCENKKNCNFTFKFMNLANLYALIIKLRIMGDYTMEFYNNKNIQEFITNEYPELVNDFFIKLDMHLFRIIGGLILNDPDFDRIQKQADFINQYLKIIH